MTQKSRSSLAPLPLNIPKQIPTENSNKAAGSKTQRARSVSRTILQKYTYVPQNAHKTIFGVHKFGSEAPHFTIPSSRRDSSSFSEQAQFPGPGAYDPFEKVTSKTSRPIPTANYRSNSLDCGQLKSATLTSNIDFIDIRKFPESKPAYIGVKTKGEFYDIIESPGPSYLPPQTDKKLPHKILSSGREYCTANPPEKTDDVGPGSYNVKYKLLDKREPSYDMSGTCDRYNWMSNKEYEVGPGSYSPIDIKKNDPQWSIGKKSRPGRKTETKYKEFYDKIRENGSKNLPKDLIAVDQIIIHLELLRDPKACRSYIVSHPQLRNIVHEILDKVLKSKPKNPLDFIEKYFKEIDDNEYGGFYQAKKTEVCPVKKDPYIQISDSSEEENENEQK